MILEIHGLSAGYGRIQILKDIGLEVDRGEIVCLVGANGSGKSTLLRVISGIVSPFEGRISFDGRDITGIKSNHIVKSGLCHVPEGRQVFGSLSVRQNLLLGAYARKHTKAEFLGLLESAFNLFPVLKNRMEQKAGTLSGGEQQMLAIGRALMSRPKMLLLDEPSLGLAPLMVQAILNAIEDLRESGISILLVEQNVGASMEVSDRAYVMETGKIIAHGLCSDLVNDDRIRKSYLGI
jgi:branched-chain amino acid transport system ATP-binding protein